MPTLVTELANACRARGGRAMLVGGGVRDAMLGRAVVDWDLEVYGLEEDVLRTVLARLGTVNAVGRSFGVYKLTRGGVDLDVSMPRRDSKIGAGHRGIHVEGDPSMSMFEATRRRDLSINALLQDPLTGEVIDPHGGIADLHAGVLRAVDSETFLEDPLRALRVVQFAARLGFAVDPSLITLCRTASLDELPAERVQAEWGKFLLKGLKPGHGLAVARAADILVRVFPHVVDDPRIDALLDALIATRAALEPEGRRYALMLSAWMALTPTEGITATLDRLWIHKWLGYPLRDRVIAAAAAWQDDPIDDAGIRRLSIRAEPALALPIRAHLVPDPTAWLRLARARELGIAERPLEALLKGRHLQAMGIKQGPALGRLLREVFELQLDGVVTDEAGAIAAARRLMELAAR